MKGDAQIGPVLSHPSDPHILCLVQRVDQLLLDSLIKRVIQGVQLQDAGKDLLEILPDLRHGKGDDGKASLLALHILVHQRPRLCAEGDRKLLLLFIQPQVFFLRLRLKGSLTKAFDHGGASVHRRQLLHLFQRVPVIFQPVVHIPFIIKKRLVIFVVVFKLPVGDPAVIAVLSQLPPLQNALRRAVDHSFQPDPSEIFHRETHHALKAQKIPDVDGFLFGDVLSRHSKANPVAFRIGIRHQPDLILRKAVQITRHTQFIFRNIFPETVQIAQVGKVAVHDDAQREILLPVKGSLHVLFQHGFRIIAGKPVQGPPHLLRIRKAVFLLPRADKHLIDLQKQLQPDRHGLHVLFIRGRDQAPLLRRQEGKHLPELLSKLRHREPGIGPAVLIEAGKHILIKLPVPLRQLLQGGSIQPAVRDKIGFLQKPLKDLGRFREIPRECLRASSFLPRLPCQRRFRLLRDLPEAFPTQGKPFLKLPLHLIFLFHNPYTPA